MIIWMAWLSLFPRAVTRIVMTMIAAFALGSSATAQPCNPVIDGTYCAENMPKGSSKARAKQRTSPQIQPVQPIRDPSSTSYDTPATWGGISFSNTGERCVGLMRRGRCK